MANFPYIHRIRVDNYALYVGSSESPGLDHTFCPGVNVIVGINGLGKTTLLNMLLRCLTGPFDIPAGDQLGDKKRTISSIERSWFRRRVPDDAVNATVYIEFFVGEHFYSLKRSLVNLDLVELDIDQRRVQLSTPAELEAAYQTSVSDAAGLTRFGDFILLLKYVIFFLEDRRTLVWDASAQGEILSILFGKSVSRQRYVYVFEEYLSKDSEYRNTLNVLNKWKARLQKDKSTLAGGQLDMLLKEAEETKRHCEELTSRRQEIEESRDSLRRQIENRRSEVYERRATLAKRIDTFYQSFFPTVSDSARYLLSQFEAGTGCLVCGTRDEGALHRVRQRVALSTCPVCESAVGAQDSGPHTDSTDIEFERLSIAETEASVAEMIQALRKADSEHATVAADAVAAFSKAATLREQLQALGNSVPEVQAALTGLGDRVSAIQGGLDQIEVERIKLAEEFKELATTVDAEVRAVSSEIEQHFGAYISGFLAEDCRISYSTRDRTLGQRARDSFPFPHFVPALTSGVYRHSESVRDNFNSVSESQREFVDLAFRMALIATAAPRASAMLVLETPEASLDSVFIPRAADLLRRFATRSGTALPTRLIATSNVNREQMIPALFGAYPDAEFHEQVVGDKSSAPPTLAVEDRQSHVLDLLAIAAPTRALERFRGPYEAERNRAIYPERFGGTEDGD